MTEQATDAPVEAPEGDGGNEDVLLTPPESTQETQPTESVAREEPVEGAEIREEPPLEGTQDESASDDPFRPQAEERPEWVPEQFWNAEEGRLETQKLAKSYADLRAHMNQQQVGAPEEYKIETPEILGELTDDDVEAFREANLTNAQAEKMVSYLSESVLPVLQNAIADGQMEALASRWNMEKDNTMFQERMTRLRDWAYQNYPEDMVKHMARTADGVDKLFSLMRNQSSDSVRGEPTARQRLSKAELDSKVNDPRYWTDEAFRAEVERQVGVGS